MDQNFSSIASEIPTGEVGVEPEYSLPTCLPNGNPPFYAPHGENVQRHAVLQTIR